MVNPGATGLYQRMALDGLELPEQRMPQHPSVQKEREREIDIIIYTHNIIGTLKKKICHQ